jgi:hypothetical protein
MARTITGTISSPFVLSLSDPLASGGSDTPLTVAATALVSDGIRGPAGTDWTIFNNGTISESAGPAISLAGDGVLYNSGTLLALGGDGIEIGGTGLVLNQGSISGQTDGIDIRGNGLVTNLASIFGFNAGVSLAQGNVANWGSIRGSDGFGVIFTNGGSVANFGSITALGGGILGLGGTTSIMNRGLIGGFDGSSSGINLAGGSVTNLGTILGSWNAIQIDNGTVTNQGTISSFFEGITLGNGSVTNSGSILGGIEITGGSGTVVNQGLITAGARNPGISILFDDDTANNLLVIKPGAIFNGAAEATSGTNSTIELAKGSGAVSGVGGGQFDGFDTLKVDAGANWTLNGPNTIGTVLNNGRLDIAGSLDVTTAVDPNSTGLFQLDGPSTLEIAAALGTASKISFAAGSSLLIDSPALFGQAVGTSGYAGPLLEKFGSSSVDLEGFGLTGLNASFSNASGLLQLTNAASQLATLKFQTSSLGAGMFHVTGDGSTGILVTHS